MCLLFLFSASFYGQSYVRVPFQLSARSNQVDLDFKTPRPHGLLLLAAGSTDYFSIELSSGIIKVQIDLGSGEAILNSPPGLRLDDSQWHHLSINRTNGNLVLTIDEVITSSTVIPGKFSELNIQHGIFLGGLGTFTDAYDGTFKYFRGCLKKTFFNKYDILSTAQQMNNPVNTFEISWSCDDEFDAGSDQAITFKSDSSFVAFPPLHIREKGTFSCDLKTRSNTSVIFFNTGRRSSGLDYIGLELIRGKLKLSANKGSGVIDVFSDKKINNGHWHQVDVIISPGMLELRVDGQRNITRLYSKDNKYLNLAGHLYVGGIGVKDKSNAIRRGLESLKHDRGMHSSMKGCIRNVVINSRTYGFREVVVSRVVQPKCSFDFPCATEPCIEGSVCKELDNNEYKCLCNQNVCTKYVADVLAIDELRVEEGGEATLTTNVIDVIFDYQAYSIRESSVQFTVKVHPRFGSLEVNLRRRTNEDIFTLLDLVGGKVSYAHDGTDTRSDDVTIEMKITSYDANFPKQYQGSFMFVLPIRISPVNDPPKLVLVAGSTIQILKHTKTLFSNQIFNVDDPDSTPNKLRYMLTYINNDHGYFIRANVSKKEVTDFTQAEINSGIIWYMHRKDNTVPIRLKVSDGSLETAEAEVMLHAVDIDISIPINSGLKMALGTSAFILPGNLTAAANVQGQTIDLRYRIIQKPKYGSIQRKQHENHKWVTVETFSQRHINKHKIRYINTKKPESEYFDEFRFLVSAKESTTIENKFRITFQSVKLQLNNNKQILLASTGIGQVTSKDLEVISNSVAVESDQIIYTVAGTQSQGQIYRVPEDDATSKDSLFRDVPPISTFTQKDINNGFIYFKLTKPTFTPVNNFVKLSASFQDQQVLEMRLNWKYEPEESSIRFTNNGLQGVIEGGSKAILRDDLYLEIDGIQETKFSILSLPQFGMLILKDPRSNAVIQSNISEFTSKDISESKVYYKHDDSEHDKDSFSFMSIPLYIDEEEISGEIQEISGVFDIKMMMRNDNQPVREVDRVFHVVTNKNRPLTIKDVSFSDPDIDYDASNLKYTRRGIPNGDIVDRESGAPVYQFTQQDLIDKKLLFQHSGAEYGRAALWVTDGQFFTNSLFEIQASPPFVKIQNNTGITVKKGSFSSISSHNLSLETNIFLEPSDINVVLIEEPLYGHLRIRGKKVSEFTYDDLLSSNVKFWHDGSANQEDKFKYAIVANEAKVQGIFPIVTYLESQLQPPRITHNKILEVSEGSGAIITQNQLNVHHPDSIPTDIVYTVTTKPQYGAIYVKGILSDSDQTTFTQQDIIDDYVKYTNTRTGVLTDKMVFDVSNQFQTLRNLEFFIEIVPNILVFETEEVKVKEGGRQALQPNHFKLKGRFYQGKEVVYEIKQQPVKNEIYYEHDGSERLKDEFTVVASLSDKSKASLPHVVTVTVESVNDQAPRIIVNSVLEVWKGSVTLLTNQSLLAEDPDSFDDDIIFRVSSPTNGHIAYLDNTFREISQFTQSEVDKGLIVFVHEGDNLGEFNIQATDGVNNDQLQIFHIKAKPLVLTLVENNPLQVFPATLQPITRDVLYTTTNAKNVTKPITYTLETRPRRGKIVVLDNGVPLEVTSFTQNDVDDAKIFFKHSGNIHHWSESDSFFFEISTTYAEPLKEELIDIQISYGNINSGNIDQFLRRSPPSVREGSEITIRPEHLDISLLERRLYQFGSRVSVDFMLIGQPKYGYLEKSRRRLATTDIFTQKDINQGAIRYFHDDTDTLEDVFDIAVQIRPPDLSTTDSGIDSYDYETNFTITVTPVNDQNFKLVTTTPSVQVIQGQSVNITSDHLMTSDPDTSPSGLVYEIRTAPKYGRLVLDKDTGKSVTSFTQKDVDSDLVAFISDGTQEADSFFFRVSDGVHNHYYKKFNIYILPITVKVNSKESIYLVQSESSVYISPKSLNVSTNGERSKVWYNVTKEPEYGSIYYQESQTKYFSQSDIDESLMLYIQSDLSVGEDYFICDVYVEGVNVFLSKQRYDIRVKPLLKQGPLHAPAGSNVAITKYTLDASRLAAVTGDNPVFDITKQPEFGRIVKLSRTKKDLYSVAPIYKPVDFFTHEDVVYTKVYYKADDSAVDSAASDKFSFTLRAKNVQPASGNFIIDLQP
ncbi:hypothetical protein LOTGIDRAFT_120635, partial [Lottia gigantea]